MCLVVFLAAPSPLPLLPWREDAPAFNVTELTDAEQTVRVHFSLPHVVQAGSHTSCGCGFNTGRQYPEVETDPKERADALESASRLATYVREHDVREVYACWSGDEGLPMESERRIVASDLALTEFVFEERELLIVVATDDAE